VQDERERMEALLRTVSHTINTIIPQQMEGTLRKELQGAIPALSRGMGQSLQQSMSSVIGPTIERTVTKIISDKLNDIDHHSLLTPRTEELAQNISSTLKQPIQESFADCFQNILLPAFETSTRTMFQQIHDTFQRAMAQKTKDEDKQQKETVPNQPKEEKKKKESKLIY